MPARRLPLPTRARAWAYTGPLGHLYGGLADLVTLLVHQRRARRDGGASS